MYEKPQFVPSFLISTYGLGLLADPTLNHGWIELQPMRAHAHWCRGSVPTCTLNAQEKLLWNVTFCSSLRWLLFTPLFYFSCVLG